MTTIVTAPALAAQRTHTVIAVVPEGPDPATDLFYREGEWVHMDPSDPADGEDTLLDEDIFDLGGSIRVIHVRGAEFAETITAEHEVDDLAIGSVIGLADEKLPGRYSIDWWVRRYRGWQHQDESDESNGAHFAPSASVFARAKHYDSTVVVGYRA